MDYMGEEYFKLKSTVIKYERFLLKELGFCVHIKHSHKLIITYLQMLEMDKNTALAQRSWNLMNDSLRTNVFVRFTPETIACACIYLGARQMKIPLPQSPPWWLLFDAYFEDMEAFSLELLSLYRWPRVQMESVEREITKLKEEYQKKQVEIKEVKLKKGAEVEDPNTKKGLLPIPWEAHLAPVNNSQSSQESPTPTPLPKSSVKAPLISPPHPRTRPVPKSYQVSPPPSSPPRPQLSSRLLGKRDLRVPTSRSTRSVSPLVTHARSARDQTPPPKSAPSPIRWKVDQEKEEMGRSSEEESSESRTPSPIRPQGHTPLAYRPVLSPIVLSEDEAGSDSAPAGSPSPLSLVRRENGLQERSRDEMYDRKVRKGRHRHGDRGDHRGHRESKRVRSRSNEDGDHHRDHTRHHSKHRHRERRERRDFLQERRHQREREYAYEQRSRKVDRIRR
jgi:hypothetical protein